MRPRLNSRGVAILAALTATLIVLVESMTLTPWAPFFIVYAIFCIVVPVAAGTVHRGPFVATLRAHWRAMALVYALVLAWDVGLGAVWSKLTAGAGLNPSYWVLDTAITELLGSAAQRHGFTPETAFGLFAFFVLVWAPFGEELFYRGYLFEVLRRSGRPAAAALLSSGAFGVRHMLHFAFLSPLLPVGAMAQWGLSTFGIGLLFCWLYARTRALWTVMAVHLLANLTGVLLAS